MIDLTKPVQTRDGRKARIICTDRTKGSATANIVALVGEDEAVVCYRPDGMYYSSDSPTALDLVNVPSKREVWVNVYKERRHDCFHPTKEDADAAQGRTPGNGRIACIKLTYEAIP